MQQHVTQLRPAESRRYGQYNGSQEASLAVRRDVRYGQLAAEYRGPWGHGAVGPKELEVGGGRWVERRGGLGYAFYERGVRGGVDGIVGGRKEINEAGALRNWAELGGKLMQSWGHSRKIDELSGKKAGSVRIGEI
jgi:hypothetical protein